MFNQKHQQGTNAMNHKPTDSTLFAKRLWRGGCLLCGMWLLSACGNKGDLYIPKEPVETGPAVEAVDEVDDGGTGDGLD
ncbi:LPS translocon maturation chaperone LptM [Marinicella meishanensis]|uniref:LPS translocon maturation chaperone LptM n=1 Tax=Marinicella meishanensis TaxID=2873263 RepID=UPI001CC1B0C9|nr:lipoprotein [Marinicella sp. NBU2979]